MNWTNCSFGSDDTEEAKTVDSKNPLRVKKISDENEQKGRRRLENLKDPSKDEHRKTYTAICSRFGELLVAGNYEEILKSLLTDDCEIFLFNFGEMKPVKYSLKPQGFTSLYQGTKVIKREVKENNVDSEATTAIQICYCEILNEQDQATIPQFSMEVFSFKDDKISKYRGSFGSSVSFDEFNNPFIPSLKEKMLAKAKQFTYAWADQPDLERIASLFDPSTEYKIWRWQDQKPFTFDKNNFAENFKNTLEENYMIQRVVPHLVYSEGQYILSNFVFYLEGKNRFPGEKFIWLCNCIYTFDKELNITKIAHQGEFYRQDAIEIPFQVLARNTVRQGIEQSYTSREGKKEITFMENPNITFSIELSKFGPKNLLTVDHVKGFKEYQKLFQVVQEKGSMYDWDKIVDFFIDYGDDCYDVAFTIECLKKSNSKPDEENSEGEINNYTVKKFYFENGKVVKMVMFFLPISEVIPSPYDDETFTTETIRSKDNFTV